MDASFKLPEGPWVKNWVMKCGTVFSSIYGDLYTRGFDETLGVRFKDSAYSCEGSTTACYLAEAELERVGESLAAQVVEDADKAFEWCQDVRDETDRITSLLTRLQQKSAYAGKDYFAVREALFSHISPNFAVKRAADYLPEEISQKVLPELAKARLYCEHVYPSAEDFFRRLCGFIAEKENVPQELAVRLLDDEVQHYFKERKLPAPEVLEERRAGCALWYHDARLALFSGPLFPQAKERLNFLPSREFVKGTPAFKGRAKGVARIIFHPGRVTTFNAGDVLITGMTRPEYIPLMEKASAFVTDAGGMLSHAAIVAREMKKPCIVGTEVASKVFKDGDLVEVDATNGTVRKVS